MEGFMDTAMKNPKCPQKQCPTVGVQKASVCLPVKVAPYANTGPIKITCCGAPVVKYNTDCCPGKVNDVCKFIISQQIKVEVPVDFGADVDVGETHVLCDNCDCPPRPNYLDK